MKRDYDLYKAIIISSLRDAPIIKNKKVIIYTFQL